MHICEMWGMKLKVEDCYSNKSLFATLRIRFSTKIYIVNERMNIKVAVVVVVVNLKGG